MTVGSGNRRTMDLGVLNKVLNNDQIDRFVTYIEFASA